MMLTEEHDRRVTTQARLKITLAELVLRVQGEYHEMPGLKLTENQAQRLWGLDDRTCDLVLMTLVERQFLKRTPAGTYVRATD
jgi:hypothetical protein